MAGFTAKEYIGSGFSASCDTLINGTYWTIPEDMRMLNLGDPKSKKNSDWYSSNAFLSYLGRVNASLLDRLLHNTSDCRSQILRRCSRDNPPP